MDTNPQAFPGLVNTHGYGCPRRNGDGELEDWSPGMTLRDYFAAQYRVWRDVDGNLLGWGNVYVAEITGTQLPVKPVVTASTDEFNKYWRELLGWHIKAEAALKLMHADAMLNARQFVPVAPEPKSHD
jgi:GH43 family beta-xylosidase